MIKTFVFKKVRKREYFVFRVRLANGWRDWIDAKVLSMKLTRILILKTLKFWRKFQTLSLMKIFINETIQQQSRFNVVARPFSSLETNPIVINAKLRGFAVLHDTTIKQRYFTQDQKCFRVCESQKERRQVSGRPQTQTTTASWYASLPFLLTRAIIIIVRFRLLFISMQLQFS